MADDGADAGFVMLRRQSLDGRQHVFARHGFFGQQLVGDLVQGRLQTLQQRDAVAVELLQQLVGGADGLAGIELDMGVAHGLQAEQRAVRSHAQRADHRQRDLRGFLQVLAGAGGDFVEIQLLGTAPGQQHLDAVAQLGVHVQALVLHRRHQGHAQCLAAWQDGDLLHPADIQRRGHQRVAGLVHGDALAVGGRHRRHAGRLLTDAAGFHCIDEVGHVHLMRAGTGGQQCGMVGDVAIAAGVRPTVLRASCGKSRSSAALSLPA